MPEQKKNTRINIFHISTRKQDAEMLRSKYFKSGAKVALIQVPDDAGTRVHIGKLYYFDERSADRIFANSLAFDLQNIELVFPHFFKLEQPQPIDFAIWLARKPKNRTSGIISNEAVLKDVESLKSATVSQILKAPRIPATSVRFVNTQSDILDAIQSELDATPKYFDFTISRTQREGSFWKVFVDLSNANNGGGLDDSLEGATAWWAGPQKGAADVLSVIPEAEQINLRFASCPPPTSGKIRLYPPRYLEALFECWNSNLLADSSLSWLNCAEKFNSFNDDFTPSTKRFKWLRRNQAKAFKLLGWNASFLWGPPGTGKTTTLGAMLAQYLIQFPNSKILLFSTTNIAVDQALVAVDKAIEQFERTPAITAARKKCFRVGNHFVASQYQGREHLLPVKDTKLIEQLAALEARKPEPEKVAEYALWKQKIEHLRAEIKRQAATVLDNARLAAMTTTRAVFTYGELVKRKPFDLIVFDEASQVGLAQALILAPLGKRCLFAGDPNQLSPIVRSTNDLAKDWLGRSMFSQMKKSNASTCLLNEQSRMAAPICQIVSNVFYDGELVVADDCKNNAKWDRDRNIISVSPIGRKHTHVEHIDKNGIWSQKYHGPIRYDSAVFIKDLVCKLKTHLDESDIIVLTPFRAQRTLLKAMLRSADCKKVMVSTVHRAQGSERHTVIFDPVLGDNPFLRTDDAPRLINVAISRAQARFVTILSPSDRQNPLFNQICNVIENSDKLQNSIPISYFVSQPNFPTCAVDKVVQIKQRVGKITDVLDNGKSFKFLDFSTGQERKYISEYVAKNSS